VLAEKFLLEAASSGNIMDDLVSQKTNAKELLKDISELNFSTYQQRNRIILQKDSWNSENLKMSKNYNDSYVVSDEEFNIP